MSDVIRLLPDSVANQIAAGEVIQRPASVIKELVENSIDAGATSVSIFIVDAGRTLIQVVDDGCGMSETDARLAFERHATSKIRTADDLFGLATMGFRGEALASICAVAQVELRTRLHNAEMGTRLIINGSKVETQEPQLCSEGSNLMVKNLFFNVPARRKFLKKDAVEMSHILREFERLALVNPSVQMSITSNGTLLHHLLGASLKQRIADLFGKGLDKQIIPVRTDTSIVRLDGFVSLPQHARKRNMLQYFFVNGRNMRHPYFHKAVMHCFENLIPSDMQPNYFLNFTVDPATIDVNIHPTKNEIKFENEAGIWQIIVAAVRESLGRFNASSGIEFDVEDAPEIPVFKPDATASHDVELDTGYNPFVPEATQRSIPELNIAPAAPRSHASSAGGSRQSSINTRDWEKLFNDFTANRDDALAAPAAELPQEPETPSMLSGIDGYTPPVGWLCLHNRLIVTAASDGLLVIDRYRAHVRVLFDEYMQLEARNAFHSQSVLFPEIIELSPSQQAELSELMPQLIKLGFNIETDLDGHILLTGVPVVLGPLSPRESLMQILDDHRNTPLSADTEPIRRLTLAMARAAAVRPGQQLPQSQVDRLLADLFASPEPSYTPDGLKIMEIIDMPSLTKMLG